MLSDASGDGPQISLKPIGVIRTPFHDRADAPQQPQAGEGLITLFPGHNFEQALEDLNGFQFIWILAWFHRNRGWKPKVMPPRGSKIKRGVFATRSPHRPNPIALSLARLLEVMGRTVRVADTDLLDGTPILDLKPYLPDIEAQPHAFMGWPSRDRVLSPFNVKWSPLAQAQASWLEENFALDFMNRPGKLLSHNPFPGAPRRIKELENGNFEMAHKSWRFRYRVSKTDVHILKIASGYTVAAIQAEPDQTHECEAHLAFHARWPVD